MRFSVQSLVFILTLQATIINAQTHDSIPSVKIGWQVWMVKNLNVDHFANGDPIPQMRTAAEWKKASDEGSPAWCYYNNNLSNGEKCGKLYNWWAVHDTRGLAPKGWHVPTDLEWSLIINYLGGETIAGVALKNTFGWDNTKDGGNGNGYNNSGFSGIPAGNRVNNGNFTLLGKIGGWWSSTQEGYTVAWTHFLYNEDPADHRSSSVKGCGFSVRCIKD